MMPYFYHKLGAFYKKYIPFFEGDVLYYAASLSFYTLLTIVPLLLLIITVMTYIPQSEDYILQLNSYLQEHLLPVQSSYLIDFINATFDKRFEIGLMGVLYALFSSLFFFYDYDYIVAKMFGSKKNTFFKTLGIYLLFILLMPMTWTVLIIVTTFLQAKVNFVFTLFPLTSSELLAILSVWMAFLIAMKMSISIKVGWKTLLVSSLVIAFFWSLIHRLFLWYILHSSMYKTIYGSFASVFFFFIWIYTSWIIYLYGLKLCKVLYYKNEK